MKKTIVLFLIGSILLIGCHKQCNVPISKFYDGDTEISVYDINVPINSYKEIKIITSSNCRHAEYPVNGNLTYTLTQPYGEAIVLFDTTNYNRDLFRIVHQADNLEDARFSMTFNDSICKVGDQYILHVFSNWDEPVEKSLKINIVE